MKIKKKITKHNQKIIINYLLNLLFSDLTSFLVSLPLKKVCRSAFWSPSL